MKVLILLFSVLAAAYAGYGYHGPQHIPVIHNGVPVETPEVQHAKAAHYAALAEASAKSGYDGYDNKYDNYDDSYDHYDDKYDDKYGYSVQHVTKHYPEHHSVAHHTSYNHGPIIPAYETTHVLPKIGHDGKPLDTPEVELAKADHFAAVSKALASVSHGHEHHYRKRRGIYDYHVPTIGYGGVPEDTYEVQKAKAEHFAAVAAVSHPSISTYDSHVYHEPHYKSYYSYEIPQIGHDGKPLDTAEVEYEKAKHFAAHKEALERLHSAKYGYADSYSYGHDGPIDTPEVQHAKALHFAAHAAAKSHHY